MTIAQRVCSALSAPASALSAVKGFVPAAWESFPLRKAVVYIVMFHFRVETAAPRLCLGFSA